MAGVSLYCPMTDWPPTALKLTHRAARPCMPENSGDSRSAGMIVSQKVVVIESVGVVRGTVKLWDSRIDRNLSGMGLNLPQDSFSSQGKYTSCTWLWGSGGSVIGELALKFAWVFLRAEIHEPFLQRAGYMIHNKNTP
ncbi:hypothetical protein PoB_002814100 [Plakobranchus ocellatus]|uniref:Uncharacterized protein n=1 Tax=Plakobranchus ocellatus TaxID=259542 RepID=A0AAV4A4R8_9GAST|nr:hypothetical protein PoB_002814100 [Plakobranchus ocellatus]